MLGLHNARRHYNTASHNQEAIVDNILDILEQYGKHFSVDASHEQVEQLEWIGRKKFFDRIHRQVKQNQVIKMILPAFPWKSVCILHTSAALWCFDQSVDQHCQQSNWEAP
jgi:hypothetical protein